LFAYSYDGSSFTPAGQIKEESNSVFDVAVSNDGNIFIAQTGNGLKAYTYDGASFTNTANIDEGGSAEAVAIGPDGTVYLANHSMGLMAYEYTDTSFIPLGNVYVGGYATDVSVDTTGYIFSASGGGGLQAYTFADSTFTLVAEIDEFVHVSGVTDVPKGIVFAACGGEGMYAFDFSGIVVGMEDNFKSTPKNFTLFQNYPNPFNPTTTIEYDLPKASQVKIEIYNLLGKKIKTILDENKDAGNHKFVFNSNNLASGVYFFRIQAGKYSNSKKMILLR
jgi:hypothetical protein